jgi:spore coat polysaccharide biosynthesis predicted glycosyltransferase SpsG
MAQKRKSHNRLILAATICGATLLASFAMSVAENQKEIALAIENMGLGVYLGWANQETYKTFQNVFVNFLCNSDQRRKISILGKSLIDGMGCLHICKNI